MKCINAYCAISCNWNWAKSCLAACKLIYSWVVVVVLMTWFCALKKWQTLKYQTDKTDIYLCDFICTIYLINRATISSHEHSFVFSQFGPSRAEPSQVKSSQCLQDSFSVWVALFVCSSDIALHSLITA